ncbi:hypothetical protein [Kitasatospora sp. NPDC096204]|uniref:hypothetical protein n=1 Tax=Kitasatospora sp. NPDC096204 TaxID=3364094 RepID=UPI00382672F9
MLRTRLAEAAAVVALALAAVLPAVALPAAGHATASVSHVEAADVHDDNMIWQ